MTALGRLLCRIGIHRWVTGSYQGIGSWRDIVCTRCGRQDMDW